MCQEENCPWLGRLESSAAKTTNQGTLEAGEGAAGCTVMQIKCTLNTRSLILELICQCLQRQVVLDLWPMGQVWRWVSGCALAFSLVLASALAFALALPLAWFGSAWLVLAPSKVKLGTSPRLCMTILRSWTAQPGPSLGHSRSFSQMHAKMMRRVLVPLWHCGTVL